MQDNTQQGRARRIFTSFLVVTICLLLNNCAFVCRFCKVQPDERVLLLDDNGTRTDTIDLLGNLRVAFADLTPGTRYTLRVVDEQGRQLSYAQLAAGRRGDIPAFTLLFGENLFPCRTLTQPVLMASAAMAPQRAVVQVTEWAAAMEAHRYFVEVLDQERVVRRAPFSIRDDGRPKIYVADRHGCPRSGLIRGRDDVYVVGRNFPTGSRVRLFAVEDQRLWKSGDELRDITGADGASEVEAVQLGPTERHFFMRIWPQERTATGLYDVIARYSDVERQTFDALDVVSAANDVGMLIQADASDPHIEQNMTVPATDSVLYYLFQDKYFNSDDVWVAINPKDRPGGVSAPQQSARIYVVNHMNESQWVHGMTLTDVSSNGYEEMPIKGSCRNQNEIRVWEAPLTNGNYDVVVDFAPFGVYDQGQDIVDELNNVGFQVVDPASFAVVYPVNPLRVFPDKETPTGLKRDDIFVVAKISPAAAGTSIYWDSRDIDDPSADAAPVDPNGTGGDDNRGNYGAAPGAPDGDDGKLDGENASGIATTTTNSGGIAFVRIHVTSQPGDNFGVRGSTSSTFASFDDSAAITAWRRLHVEIDSMGAPSGTTVSGNITAVNFNPATNTSQVTVDIAVDDGSGGSGGRFENGVLTAGGNNYAVNSSAGSLLTVQGNPPTGVSFTLVDDDVVPADVPDPDVGDLVRAYAPAFILPVFDTGQNTSNAAFDLNTEAGERATQINSTKATPASINDYWTVTVHGGFQEPLTQDNDPDDEGTSRAWAYSSVQGVIYLQESIRDWIQAPVAKGGAGGVDPDPTCDAGRSPRRQEILVHEVGHLLSLSHGDGGVTAANPCGGVMQPSCCGAFTRKSSNFTQQSLHELRSIAEPD